MRYLVVGMVILAMVISGCQETPSETRQISPETPSSPAPLEGQAVVRGKLNTSRYEFAPTWIPVQPVPRFEERRSLTKEDTWPKNGDEVEVVCNTTGDPYPHPIDPAKSLEEWYRIKIPNTSSVGYIETFWVDMPAPVKNC